MGCGSSVVSAYLPSEEKETPVYVKQMRLDNTNDYQTLNYASCPNPVYPGK